MIYLWIFLLLELIIISHHYSASAEEWLTSLNPDFHIGTKSAGIYGSEQNSGIGICQVRYPGCHRIPDTYRSPELREIRYLSEQQSKQHNLKKDAIMLAAGKFISRGNLWKEKVLTYTSVFKFMLKSKTILMNMVTSGFLPDWGS